MISLLTFLFVYDQSFLSGRNEMFGKIPYQLSSPRIKNVVPKDDDSFPPNVAVQPEFSVPSGIVSMLYLTKNKTRCLIGKDIIETCISNPSHEKCKVIPENTALDKNIYFFCTDLENIYNDAKKIRSDTAAVYVYSSINITDIDVGKLNHKNIAFIFQSSDPFDNLFPDENDQYNWFSQFILGIRSSSQEKLNLDIICVQYQPLILTILGSPINTESIALSNTQFSSNSEIINSDRYETIESGLKNSNIMDKLKIKQLSIISGASYNGCDPFYRISYKQDQMEFYQKSPLDTEFGSEFKYSIKYDKYEKIDLISTTNYVEFYVDNKDITKTKDINITIFDHNYYNSDKIRDDSIKHKVTLATTGDWSGIKSKTKVIFTSFQDYVTLDNKCNSKIEVEKVEANVLPIAPSDETIRENKKLELTIDSNDPPETIKGKIKDAFTNGNNEKIDYYVVYNSNKPLPELDLKPNQYIQFTNDQNVDLNAGNLNILTLDNDRKISISVKNPQNAILSIKNQARSTITIDTIKKDNTKQDISIKANSEIYNQLTLKIGENVRSIKIDSINFHKSGNIIVDKNKNSDASLIVSSLTVHPQTKGKLNDVEIDEKLAVSQASSLELKNVKFDQSDLVLNLVSYNNDDYQTPLLQGNLGSGPKSITLTKIKDGSPAKDKEYLLFEGTFEKGCDNWADSINLKGNKFNKKICKSFEDQRLQEYYGSLFVKKGKNKLSAGQIAGIVIGCVAFVAIVVVIIVVVIKKRNKKNKDNESSQENESA